MVGGGRGEFFYLTIPGDGIIPEGKNGGFFDPPPDHFCPSPKGGLISTAKPNFDKRSKTGRLNSAR